jgi:hypothetical protein
MEARKYSFDDYGIVDAEKDDFISTLKSDNTVLSISDVYWHYGQFCADVVLASGQYKISDIDAMFLEFGTPYIAKRKKVEVHEWDNGRLHTTIVEHFDDVETFHLLAKYGLGGNLFLKNVNGTDLVLPLFLAKKVLDVHEAMKQEPVEHNNFFKLWEV